LGKELRSLDRGWVEKFSLIHVKSRDGGMSFHKNPTPEEERQESAKIVIVYLGDAPIHIIDPGDSFRFNPPCPLEDISLSSPSGTAKVTVTVIPDGL
jgi:hypothetical protein